MGIQFGGLASGLDSGAIIQALLQVQARPINLLQIQRGQEQERLSEVSALEKLVKTLEDKSQDLSNLDGFFEYAVTPAKEGVADFVVNGQVTPGNHTLVVNQLASAARYAFEPSATVSDPDDPSFGAGDISFTYDGELRTVSVAAGSSLNDIASAITTVAGEDVTASVINVGTSNSPDYQLVVAGNDTGADYDLVGLSVDPGIGLDQPLSAITPPQNAQITIDGLAVERSTNVFDEVLPGVSFTVQSADTTTFTTDADADGTVANLQEFVDAYNAVVRYIDDQSEFSEEDGPGGALFGDRILRTVTAAFGRALFDPDLDVVQNDTAGFSTLGLVGVELESDGTLSIDGDKVKEKLLEDPEAFENLFLNDTDGVLTKLNVELDNLLDGGEGPDGESLDSLFTGRRKALDSIVEGIDDQIERLELNLERFEESLIQRFANLESIIGGLNSQSAFLAQNLAATS